MLAPHAVDIAVTISSLIASQCFTFAEPFETKAPSNHSFYDKFTLIATYIIKKRQKNRNMTLRKYTLAFAKLLHSPYLDYQPFANNRM